MKIELCNFDDGKGNENWITFKNAAQLSDYIDPWRTHYKEALAVIKARKNRFRGYKIRYIEDL